MEGLGLSLFPRINKEDIKVWDAKRNASCGFLSKKAGKQSTFRKGKWQKRWFVIKTELHGHDNYTLCYYHTADEMSTPQTYKLEGASLETRDGNEFKIDFKDGVSLELDAESHEVTKLWVDTLSHVIEVATARGRALSERMNRNMGQGESFMRSSAKALNSPPPPSLREPKPPQQPAATDTPASPVPASAMKSPTRVNATSKPFSIRQRTLPTVRLDLDVNSIPPRTEARMQFEEMFITDVSRSLQIEEHLLEVHSIKGMLGMDWLTVVEFDIYIHKEAPQPHRRSKREGEEEDGSEEEEGAEEVDQDSDDLSDERLHEQAEEEEYARFERRKELLQILSELIKNPHSPLYSGFVTCKLDPTYPLLIADDMNEEGSLGGRDMGGRVDDANNMLFSTDANILTIMEKYKNVEWPQDYMDYSHFEISIAFEGQVRTLQVPNPLILRNRCCGIYPFEIMQALGLLGTAQELWVEPKGLAPRGMPSYLSDPIYFTESSRANGSMIINASKLKANLVYDLICTDYRQQVLNSLSEAEIDQIRITFDTYDIDGDGTVSKAELEELVRQRTIARRAVIDEKFNEFVKEISAEREGEALNAEIQKAERVRRTHYQQLTESQNKLIHMFEAADIDGNGTLSLNEFMLAEAWWQRCTLNPGHVHMF